MDKKTDNAEEYVYGNQEALEGRSVGREVLKPKNIEQTDSDRTLKRLSTKSKSLPAVTKKGPSMEKDFFMASPNLRAAPVLIEENPSYIHALKAVGGFYAIAAMTYIVIMMRPFDLHATGALLLFYCMFRFCVNGKSEPIVTKFFEALATRKGTK